VTRVVEKRNTYMVLVEKSEGRKHLGDVVLDGRIILKLFRRRIEVVERIRLAQDRDKWRALMDIKMNFSGFHKTRGIP